jgi:hypothetical protein
MRCLGVRGITLPALFLLTLLVTPVEKVQATSLFTGEFFACDSSGDLFKINTATGSATLIGNMGAVMTDIAFSPSGELFGVTFTDLYSIDPTTAASTLIGSLGINDSNALEFVPDGRLFLASRNSTLLRTVNTTTGATTVVGDMGVSSSGDLAFDLSSGNLFLSAASFPNDNLYQVDPNTAASTLVGSIGFPAVFGIDFFFGSTLFGLTNGGALITINTTSGAGTFVANTGVAAFGASTAPTIDHYKCYEAKGHAPRETVNLEDQFGKEPKVRVGKPAFFCNPVNKNGEGILNPEVHLTCYEIERKGGKRDVVVENQFGEQTLTVDEPELLCVPSGKTAVVPHEDKDGGR